MHWTEQNRIIYARHEARQLFIQHANFSNSKIIIPDIAPYINDNCYRKQSKRMVKPTSAFRTTANSQANENQPCCKHERSAEFFFIHHLVLWSGRHTAFSQEIRTKVLITTANGYIKTRSVTQLVECSLCNEFQQDSCFRQDVTLCNAEKWLATRGVPGLLATGQ